MSTRRHGTPPNQENGVNTLQITSVRSQDCSLEVGLYTSTAKCLGGSWSGGREKVLSETSRSIIVFVRSVVGVAGSRRVRRHRSTGVGPVVCRGGAPDTGEGRYQRNPVRPI